MLFIYYQDVLYFPARHLRPVLLADFGSIYFISSWHLLIFASPKLSIIFCSLPIISAQLCSSFIIRTFCMFLHGNYATSLTSIQHYFISSWHLPTFRVTEVEYDIMKFAYYFGTALLFIYYQDVLHFPARHLRLSNLVSRLSHPLFQQNEIQLD